MARTGTVTGGGGGRVAMDGARYQLRAAVSAPGRERLRISRSISDVFLAISHSRNRRQSSAISCCSAVPVWRKKVAYQVFSRWRIVGRLPIEPFDKVTYRSIRSGCVAVIYQPTN